MGEQKRTSKPRGTGKFSAADWERYQWLLSQATKALATADGFHIFDLHVALPPGRTLEESIDVARRPFTPGQALTPTMVRLTRNRSTVKFVACKPLTIKGYEEFRLGVHQEDGHRFRWHVTEFSTGSSVSGPCATEDAAIQKASQRITKYRPAYFRQLVADSREWLYARPRR